MRPTTKRPRRWLPRESLAEVEAIFAFAASSSCVAHAQALVEDADDDELARDAGGDRDGRLRLGEDRRVLEQLGEQVGGAEGVEAVHVRVDLQVELDAVVLLDLRGGRADDVRQRHRVAQATAGVDAGEHEERLRVTTHAGGEVVEAEQVRQGARVFLGTLERVDERQLAVEEHLVAAGDVDEHLRDGATQGGLLLGDLRRWSVHRVERGGQLADLVAGRHGDRRQRDLRALTGDGHLLDESRQLLADVGGGLRQATQRDDDDAGDDEGEEQRQDGGERRRAPMVTTPGSGRRSRPASATLVGVGRGPCRSPRTSVAS